MPLYEFYCDTCDCCFEIRRTLSEGTGDVICPSCDNPQVQRVYTPVMAFSNSGGQRTALGGSGCAGCAAVTCSGCAGSRRK